MSLLVTGSIGIDTVSTPFGKSENCIGGSAVYFSMAASFFSPVRFVGVIGNDCPFDLNKVFADRDVDLAGLEVRDSSKTFRWQGSYQGDMTQAITEALQMNVLAEKPPIVPPQFVDSQYVFLANTHPALQMQLLEQLKSPKFIVADTMNCYIQNQADKLKELLTKIDALILNEAEAKLLVNNDNLAVCAEKLLEMGPKVIIIKEGPYGSMMATQSGEIFQLSGYPTKDVKDPTGAGDSFAGAMMGYLASVDKADSKYLRKAIAYGTVTASLVIEGFSLSAIAAVGKTTIDQRLDTLRKMMEF